LWEGRSGRDDGSNGSIVNEVSVNFKTKIIIIIIIIIKQEVRSENAEYGEKRREEMREGWRL
jgi:hypothetical protein